MTQPADRFIVAKIELNPRGADYGITYDLKGKNKYDCQDIIHTTELLLERFKQEYEKAFNEEYAGVKKNG